MLTQELKDDRRTAPIRGDRPGKEELKDTDGSYARIRCPKCGWRPRARDRWMCSCRHVWNTFDTRGRCPACAKQWEDTQCLVCHGWSRHVDWYEERTPPAA